MLESYWPLFGLRVRTPRLTIRLPTDADLVALLSLIDRGIHDPLEMPFLRSWTDVPRPQRDLDSLKWWWSQRAQWSPDEWTFTGMVEVDNEPVGMQDLSAKNFSLLGVVSTGSWLGLEFQGRGLGKEMRAAILHLAFEGIGAQRAETSAFVDNERSLGVTRSLGYVDNGLTRTPRRGEIVDQLKFRLDRSEWLLRRREDIEIIGLDPCLSMFGAIRDAN